MGVTLADIGRYLFAPRNGETVPLSEIGRLPDDAPKEEATTFESLSNIDPYLGTSTKPSWRAQQAFNELADHYADSIIRLATIPGRAFGTYGEPVTDEEMREWAPGMALTMLGVGSPRAMTGSAGATGGRLGGGLLPMDEASRMGRAKEAGFKTDMPLYHGTATEFPAFSLETPARNSRGPLAQLGVWTTRDPAYASDFAALSADRATGSSPQVLPLLHRAEKPATFDAAGLSQREIAGAVLDAWAAGHDAVLIQNYTMGAFSKVAPTANLVVRNPNQLRSRFAAFDPSKSHLADLLASLAIVPAAGVLTFGSGDSQ